MPAHLPETTLMVNCCECTAELTSRLNPVVGRRTVAGYLTVTILDTGAKHFRPLCARCKAKAQAEGRL
jgi:hypothetical protein